MKQTTNKVRLDTHSSRRLIPHGKKLYIERIITGLALGYRRNLKGGVWYARRHNEGTLQYTFAELGLADDLTDADGVRVLTRDQATQKAREWFREVNEGSAGISRKPYTIGDAVASWLQTQTGPTAVILAKNYILPDLGHIVLKKLRKETLHNWLQELGKKPTVRSQSPNCKIPFDINDPETRRKRKESANRVLRSLKAILNLARSNGHIESDTPWATLKEFPDVAKLRTEYLTVEEGSRFIEVCPTDFRKLVQAALYTGCRYGELCGLKVQAFDSENRSVTVMQGKTGKSKVVYLTPDESNFFEDQIEGKRLDDFMFLRDDGTEWKKDHQRERMKAACEAAQIEKHITFHNLRHTFASLLAMGGTQPELIQLQMGHSSARMTARYTHFSPSYAADTIRANKPSFSHDSKPGPVLVAKAG
jgi:integrase